MTEPFALGAVEARRLIGARKLSPVELLESCIGRIEQVNPHINALVTLCLDRARSEAQAATEAVARGEALSLLHGLPVGIKDLEETQGVATTYGSPLFRDHVPGRDQGSVRRLRQAGAIVIGKTNTPAFGTGANTTNELFGATRNPHCPDRTAGGSSGGSAAALASRMVPLCTGGDTGGSLRIPAAWCGIAAIRPGPGLVANERRAIGGMPFSMLGPMARSCEDLGLMLQAMAGYDPYDPLSYATGERFDQLEAMDLASLRVAVSVDLGLARVDPGIAGTFAGCCALLRERFGVFTEQDPPLEKARECNRILRGLFYLARHEELFASHPEAIDDLGRRIHEEAKRTIGLEDAVRGQEMLGQIHQQMADFFAQHDLLIAPTVAVSPLEIEQTWVSEIDGHRLETVYEWLALTWALTVADCPVLALPCGRDSTGAPFGIQLAMQRGRERQLLAIGREIERLLPVLPWPDPA